MRMVARSNEFIQSSAPWTVFKDPAKTEHLDAILAALSRQLVRQSVLLAPFVPKKAQAAWEQLGGRGAVADQRFSELARLDTAGWKVNRGDPLFPKPVPPAA
jgi:methionyl-tRNA synthetase